MKSVEKNIERIEILEQELTDMCEGISPRQETRRGETFDHESWVLAELSEIERDVTRDP